MKFQEILSDVKFKTSMEQLRNDRAGRVSTRPGFHEYRNRVEDNLESRSQERLNQGKLSIF